MGKEGDQMEIIDIKTITDGNPDISYDNPLKYHHLIQSLEKYGQLEVIVVCKDDTGKITPISGRRILRAMRQLNFSVAYVRFVDGNPEEVKIVLKELEFDTDYIKLSEMIGRCEFLPFDEETKTRLKEISEFDWTKINKPTDKTQQQISFE